MFFFVVKFDDEKEENPTEKSHVGIATSAVGHGRGHPAILLVGLDKALEGRLSFLATKGLLRLACFPADTTLKRKQHLEKSRFSSVKVKHTEFNDLRKGYWEMELLDEVFKTIF